MKLFFTLLLLAFSVINKLGKVLHLTQSINRVLDCGYLYRRGFCQGRYILILIAALSLVMASTQTEREGRQAVIVSETMQVITITS